jgi:putative ABC transport system substrate-binding protein
MAYGANRRDLYKRAAIYVDKVLRGANPGDLPIDRATKFELAINLKTAMALELIIPSQVLMEADKVIK